MERGGPDGASCASSARPPKTLRYEARFRVLCEASDDGRNACVSLEVDDADAYFEEWYEQVDALRPPKNESWVPDVRSIGPFGNTICDGANKVAASFRQRRSSPASSQSAAPPIPSHGTAGVAVAKKSCDDCPLWGANNT